MLEILRLDENTRYNETIKEIYEYSFPPYERWDFDVLNKKQHEKPFTVYAVVDNSKAIGIYVPWTFDDFIYIEFIAIDKSSRGKNYGSILLKQIIDSISKNIIIEVEPEEVSVMAQKRIEWYKRFGFIMQKQEYTMPALDNFEDKKNINFVDMKIMTTREITDEEFNSIKNILHREVYGIQK